jgi:hypothetical protein
VAVRQVETLSLRIKLACAKGALAGPSSVTHCTCQLYNINDGCLLPRHTLLPGSFYSPRLATCNIPEASGSCASLMPIYLLGTLPGNITDRTNCHLNIPSSERTGPTQFVVVWGKVPGDGMSHAIGRTVVGEGSLGIRSHCRHH